MTAMPAGDQTAPLGAHVAVDDGFADFVRDAFPTHFPGLVRLAALLGADDPEDVAQEAFTRLHRTWPRLRKRDAALAYLRTTVVNLTRSRLRHLKIARRTAHATPDAGSAEQAVLQSEEHRDVVRALRQLPRRQREALTLRYWLDLSESEIAAAMGISAGAVKSHCARGIAALEKALEGVS